MVTADAASTFIHFSTICFPNWLHLAAGILNWKFYETWLFTMVYCLSDCIQLLTLKIVNSQEFNSFMKAHYQRTYFCVQLHKIFLHLKWTAFMKHVVPLNSKIKMKVQKVQKSSNKTKYRHEWTICEISWRVKALTYIQSIKAKLQ